MKHLVHDFLVEAAQQAPDAVALICGDEQWTYAQVNRESDALAARFLDEGLRKGDRLAIVADNSAELVVALWAALKAGGVFVLVNPTTKADKLAFILNDCRVHIVMAQPRCKAQVEQAVTNAPSVAATLWTSDLAEIATSARALAPASQFPSLIDADLAGLIYTSGSTGRPKGVMLTHRNIAHNTWSISTYLALRDDDVIACLLPLSFDYGLFQIFMATRLACTVILERSFAYPRDALQRLADTQVTVLPGVPTIFAMLLGLAPFDAGLDLSSLRMLTNTAAALPPAHIRRLAELFPKAEIFSMYGLTECTRVSFVAPDRLMHKIGSVGKAMPNTEAYVVDESGRRVPPGAEGELVVRGASVMQGYWERPEATAACLRERDWMGERVLYTGDRFWADEDGYLYFAGRKDDIFKTKGEKVSPKEVENVLYELDDVVEAVVVGVPDEIDGTAIKAVVVPRSNSRLDEQTVRQHCRRRLENFMVPRFVELRDSLPKTASGKIHRASV